MKVADCRCPGVPKQNSDSQSINVTPDWNWCLELRIFLVADSLRWVYNPADVHSDADWTTSGPLLSSDAFTTEDTEHEGRVCTEEYVPVMKSPGSGM